MSASPRCFLPFGFEPIDCRFDAFSFDDFIIAFFVAGSETTLPIYVFSSIRRGVTPEINVIGTMVLGVSLLLLITAQLLLQRGGHKSR